MHFAGLRLALRADDELDICQFQQIAELGGVQDIGRADDRLVAAACIPQRYGAYAVKVGVGADRRVIQQDVQLLAGSVRRQHALD